MAVFALAACGPAEAGRTTARANDNVLTLGEGPVAELGLPNRVVPCFTLHYAMLTQPTDGLARELQATCAQAALDLKGDPCGEYARVASLLGQEAADTIAMAAADAALRACRDA